MVLTFKQKMFSWFDSFYIYDENNNPVYEVKGQLAWGHLFKIYDRNGREIGYLKERVFSFLHTFDFEAGGFKGTLQKKISFFSTKIDVDCNEGYTVEGNFTGWNYDIYKKGKRCANLSKELFRFTDTYKISSNDEDVIPSILICLAIDAIKCDHSNG